MVLTDAHRGFVQGVMSRRFMRLEDATRLKDDACRAFGQRDLARQSVADFIKPLNDELVPLEFALRITQSHDTDEQTLIFVNTAADDIAKLATSYNASQILFIKNCFELIVKADDGSFACSEINLCNNANDKKHHIPMKEAEGLLHSLKEDQWLVECDEGLTFGPRTFAELRFYLQETYNDCLKECVVCHDMVGRGESCQNGECPTKVHKRCYARVPRCPTCRTEWSASSSATTLPASSSSKARRSAAVSESSSSV